MSYAAISDLQNRYDTRVIAQLSDDTNAGTINSTVVQACLDDAAGMINTAALQGSQYLQSDMATLAASSDPTLFRMNCDIAINLIAQRRAMGLSGRVQDQVKRSLDLLDALQKGSRIFNVQGNRIADLPAVVSVTSQQEANLNLPADLPFFGGPQGTPNINGWTG